MKSAKVSMKIPTANEAHDAAELSDAELADAEEDMIVQSAMPMLIPTTETYLVKE